MTAKLRIVVIGLTITSSWGNGHATTFRGLVRGLHRRGHDVLFLECDKPWYAAHRDMPEPPWGRTALFADTAALGRDWGGAITAADLVIVGSYVPDGIAVGHLVQRLATGLTAFYDIDTPVTLAALEDGRCDYLDRAVLRGFGLYLSFTGGPTLAELETRFGARRARALFCSADPELYSPDPAMPRRWALGYLGTYSPDRQPVVAELLCRPAASLPGERFVVAGPQYPETLRWPANVERIEHSPPAEHRAFYCGQRFTLNVTRADMVRRGYSPSVRLFEAAACGTPIISDWWEGLDTLFRPGEEIVVARSGADVLDALRSIGPADARRMGEKARARVLASHTGDHRAAELEAHARECLGVAA